MIYQEFLAAALAIDPFAEVYERDGTLSIDTNWMEVGDPDVPLVYGGEVIGGRS
jgi:hypothetical protein